MTIQERQPVTLAEVQAVVKPLEEKQEKITRAEMDDALFRIGCELKGGYLYWRGDSNPIAGGRIGYIVGSSDGYLHVDLRFPNHDWHAHLEPALEQVKLYREKNIPHVVETDKSSVDKIRTQATELSQLADSLEAFT